MLIYLNGVSSAGKTSVAKEIQKILEKPILYFSIDTLLYSLAERDLKALKGEGPYAYDLNLNGIYKGYFSCLRELVKAGNFVIGDCPVYTKEIMHHFTDHLHDYENKLIVYLKCSK